MKFCVNFDAAAAAAVLVLVLVAVAQSCRRGGGGIREKGPAGSLARTQARG